MPLFGKSVDARYAEVGKSFSPTGTSTDYPDPITWAMLRVAVGAARRQIADTVALRTDLPQTSWGNDIFRLVIDGYLLGRIEEGTEGKRLRFSETSTDLPQDVGLFTIVSVRAVAQGLQAGEFSGQAPRAIKRLLEQFAMDALDELMGSLVPDTTDFRTLGALLARIVHVGREIALMEGIFQDRRKRKKVDEDLARIERDAAQRVRRVVEQLGITQPDKMAEAITESARNEIRRLGAEIARE